MPYMLKLDNLISLGGSVHIKTLTNQTHTHTHTELLIKKLMWSRTSHHQPQCTGFVDRAFPSQHDPAHTHSLRVRTDHSCQHHTYPVAKSRARFRARQLSPYYFFKSTSWGIALQKWRGMKNGDAVCCVTTNLPSKWSPSCLFLYVPEKLLKDWHPPRSIHA